MVLVDQPMTKYMTRMPSDMTKNISEMKLPRATMSGEVKTLMMLPSKRACPGLTAAASDIMVSKCNGSALLSGRARESFLDETTHLLRCTWLS